MKLRNKYTGRVLTRYTIRALEGVDADKGVQKIVLIDDESGKTWEYTSFASFAAHWEDYEEDARIIGICQALPACPSTVNIEMATEKQAEKAVEKLKAWKRLKDNGFEFEGWKRDEKYCGDFTITATDQTSCDDKDLDLLFGGEE